MRSTCRLSHNTLKPVSSIITTFSLITLNIFGLYNLAPNCPTNWVICDTRAAYFKNSYFQIQKLLKLAMLPSGK